VQVASEARGPSRVALLDVNFLVALFDADHVHHEIAHDWFADNRTAGWATCPLTENGLVRVLANPKYGSTVSAVPAIVERLEKFRASGHHRFWPDTVSLTEAELFNPALVRGHRQLSDVYLLGLARKNGGRLVTFDRTISTAAVSDASLSDLQIVGAVHDEV
jgi:toxin-antitoxin system PIN domain toxin